MYRGFNLKLSKREETLLPEKHLAQVLDENYFQELYNNTYLEKGRNLFNKDKKQIELNLDKFLLPNNSLNGSEIQNNWFPTIQADIFLSHSHQDEELANRLAGWFFEKFRLTTFVDSAIWEQSDKLLKNIDNEYCMNFDKKTYSYEKRNRSTSHVYLMLLTAINKMIDNCECIIFLNTPNSISSEDTIKMTSSPWIYSEIELTRTILKKMPTRLLHKRISKSINWEDRSTDLREEKKLDIKYTLDSHHLMNLPCEILKNLKPNNNVNNRLDILDALYEHLPINI